MVQEVHGVHPDREALGLVELNLLGQSCIDTEVGRSLKPSLAGVSSGSWTRILENDVVGFIHDDLVGETVLKCHVSAKARNRTGHRPQVLEVFDKTIAGPRLAEIVRQIADQ